jgi:hypothetical protein
MWPGPASGGTKPGRLRVRRLALDESTSAHRHAFRWTGHGLVSQLVIAIIQLVAGSHGSMGHVVR